MIKKNNIKNYVKMKLLNQKKNKQNKNLIFKHFTKYNFYISFINLYSYFLFYL